MKKKILIMMVMLIAITFNVIASVDEYQIIKANNNLSRFDSYVPVDPIIIGTKSLHNCGTIAAKLFKERMARTNLINPLSKKKLGNCCECGYEDWCSGWGNPSAIGSCQILEPTENIYYCDVEWICPLTNCKKYGSCTRQGASGPLIQCTETYFLYTQCAQSSGCTIPAWNCPACPPNQL